MQKSTKFKIGASLTLVYLFRDFLAVMVEKHSPAGCKVKIDIVTLIHGAMLKK